MSKVLLSIPVVIGIIAVVFVLMYVGDNSLFNKSNLTSNSDTKQIRLSDLLSRSSPRIGTSTAPITIVEFGDYQCTFCYKFHTNSLDSIKKEYIDTGKASLVFIDFPLNGPDSVLAAEATHCANDQNKFWPMHDMIYQNWQGERTGWVNRESLKEFASSIGIDVKSMDTCLESGKYRQQVLDTYNYGQSLEISGTPSFLVISSNGVSKIVGNQPLDVFRKVLDSS